MNITSAIVGYNAAGSGQDIRTYGVTFKADHTLVALAAGHSISDGIDGNIVGQEPLLDVLKDNGGLTETHLLLEGSPAINTGANPLALTNDQRGPGFPREIGSVDMGAVETDTGLAPGTWQVDSTDDENDGNFSSGNLSLREARSPGWARKSAASCSAPMCASASPRWASTPSATRRLSSRNSSNEVVKWAKVIRAANVKIE